MAINVVAKTVEHVELYKWLPYSYRLDAWPFTIAYLMWLILAVPKLEMADAMIILAVIGIGHILTILSTAWSVDFLCFAHAQKVKSVHDAEVCKVVPAKFSGSKEVVPILRRTMLPDEKVLLGQGKKGAGGGKGDSRVEEEEVRFEFRKQQFVFSEGEGAFHKLRFPSKETIATYGKCSGYGSEAKANAASQKWGRNAFEFPQPTFWNLFKEQCIEPFFVFQVFCVGLWCLDEYWYYSLFTLFMLLVFQSTMVSSRLRTLTELRRVRVDSQTLMAHRGGKWVKLSGVDLLPGDLVSIGRAQGGGPGQEERTVPADMLLVAGSAIANEALLTGESTPQWKGPIVGRDLNERLSVRRDKANVLFGGTKILQHTPDKSAASMKTPDGGCLAVVLRTGFDTSQGKLMRTILFSTERMTANTWESGLFILFLVFFALIAAGYVLQKGLEDPNRSRYKLFLNCSLIITSVIPPELPMELSIAVNTSLIALIRRSIYCTEPFRIPFAGKVDVCCFDKTGTLTSDDMEFRGVGVLEGGTELVTDPASLQQETVLALATCHALVFVENKLVGDPLEKAALKGVDWTFTGEEKALSRRGGTSAQIVQRHHFASHLKRMAGAPETIEEFLREVPVGYTQAYKHYTRQGSRVLALAHKALPDMPVADARTLEREKVESQLTFAGFAVFACPLRGDSARVLAELKSSSHDLVMITGDQALTACHVAAQVHILTRPAVILTPVKGGTEFEWVSPDESTRIPYRAEEVEGVAREHDLCVAGDGLSMLERTAALSLVIPLTQVFARVAPVQKEQILTTLKAAGRITLMCGDGTNDVGALKQAHCGVALLNAIPPPAAKKEAAPASPSPSGLKPKRPRAPSSSATNGLHGSSVGGGAEEVEGKLLESEPAVRLTAREQMREQQQRRMKEQQEKLKKMMKEIEEGGDGRTPMVKLGDASMASPFTAKHASVSPTTDIIKQGRSTLVTTLQMFKILGLNCLATAYVLSVMYLDGVKLGDTQATISGVFTAAFFLFISHAKPLDKLSPERPHPRIFSFYVILSLLGQFAIHLTFLASVVKGAQAYMPQECIEPDSKFHPNLVNTVSYMANMMIQVATFAVNYIGHPFNQSIRENKPFYYALTSAAVFFTVVTSDVFRQLNDGLELVKLPQPFGVQVLGMAGLMIAGCYAWEHFMKLLFPLKRQSVSTIQREESLRLEQGKKALEVKKQA
eukprot:jgi/Mesen1/7754/ME000407S06956